jgi:hypothetical protein
MRGVIDRTATGLDVSAILTRAWLSLGLRAVTVGWDLEGPARLREPLVAGLRGWFGPALVATGDQAAFHMVYSGSGPPPLWFTGWGAPSQPVDRVEAELRCVGALGPSWPVLEAALALMRFPGAGGSTVGARSLALRWHGASSPRPVGYGPALFQQPQLPVASADCLVEAVTPLQLVTSGTVVAGPPPLDLLVRSAGERLRQLCAEWGDAAEVSAVVGQAVREARFAALDWATTAMVRTERRSARTGGVQWLSGVVGELAYSAVPPSALALLAIGSELGVGKDTAFGCGVIRLSIRG